MPRGRRQRRPALAVGLAAAMLAAGGAAGSAQARPERIVSASPSTTEILFALGAGGRVVGVTRFCDTPPAAAALPKVGGFLDLSYEAIVALRPDLVTGSRNASNRAVVTRLAAAGVATLFPPDRTLAEVETAIVALGEAVGAAAEGRAIAAAMRRRVLRVRGALRGAPRPRLLFVYGHRPLVVAGPGTFADEFVRLAGARNVFADARLPYPTVSMEAVIARAPEMIVDAAMEAAGEADAGLWGRFPSIPAVAAGRLLRVDSAELLRPGPRIVDGLERLAAAIHPARFAAAAATPAPASRP